ncbi:hypothetical protein EHS25_000140 [Saitozyma podzolica]|uniref:Uncharacterized protein n=1 Tax=Saitozyma podzolica TaxID=1890683 RepID=A0A427YV85_9TREE|nr:hypothetical protein EHS25_000140 [Saitozyma podzolica]
MSFPTASLSPPRPAPLPSSSSSFSSRHTSPPVSSSHLPLAPPCPPGPSRSLSDPLMKRQWQPLVAAPLTHVDSRSSAGKLTAVGDVREELERDLSTMYVTSERAGSPDKTIRARGKKGWTGSIVSGAVSGAVTAGVYGAALGLTAYRLWSSRGDPMPDDPDPAAIPPTGEATSAITSAIPSAITSALTREVLPPGSTKPAGTVGSPVSSKGTLSEEPPPPAYEESQRVNSHSNSNSAPSSTPRHSLSHHHLTSHPRTSLSTQHQKSQQHLRNHSHSHSHSHAPVPNSQWYHPAHANLSTRSPSHLTSHTHPHAHTHAITPVSPHKTSLPRSSKHRSRSSWTSARSGSIASFEIIPPEPAPAPTSTSIILGLEGLPSHSDHPLRTHAGHDSVPGKPGRETNGSYDKSFQDAPNGARNPEKHDIDEDDGSTAVMDRLDEMSARVQSLILEGQRALAEHPTAELLPGRWEDVRAPSTPKAGSRRGTGAAASSGAGAGAGIGAGAGHPKVGSSGKMAIVRNRTSVSSLARDR